MQCLQIKVILQMLLHPKGTDKQYVHKEVRKCK
jgi:hypothetical protein